MTIQLFTPKFRVDECLEQIKECLEKGWTGLGYKTVEIENAWRDYTGYAHAHFLSSNTVGLHLALHVLKAKYNWQDGDEVITSPLTFVSSNHAIKYVNMQPVFADVDQGLCLDPSSIEQKITPKTKAVMFIGIGGNTGEYSAVRALCDKHGLQLILDAAHMAGTKIDGQQVGTDADCTVFSFQAVKNLATADSGMICFKDPADDAHARKLSWLGIDKDTYARTAAQGNYKWMYEVEEVGFKYHGNSIMASMALVALKYLDQDNQFRREIAGYYDECLADTGVRVVPHQAGIDSSRHLYQIRHEQRDELLVYLNEHQIFPGVHYRDNTEYSVYNYAKGSCPNASLASAEIISLPMHLGLTREDVVRVADVIRSFLAR